MSKEEEKILTKKEAYEAMIHLIYDFYKSTGSDDLTDILSGGEYDDKVDEPSDMAYWYMWEEAIEKVKNGEPPKRKNWIAQG